MKSRIKKELKEDGEYIIMPQVLIEDKWMNIYHTGYKGGNDFIFSSEDRGFGYNEFTYEELEVEGLIEISKDKIKWWINGYENRKIYIPKIEIIEVT